MRYTILFLTFFQYQLRCATNYMSQNEKHQTESTDAEYFEISEIDEFENVRDLLDHFLINLKEKYYNQFRSSNFLRSDIEELRQTNFWGKSDLSKLKPLIDITRPEENNVKRMNMFKDDVLLSMKNQFDHQLHHIGKNHNEEHKNLKTLVESHLGIFKIVIGYYLENINREKVFSAEFSAENMHYANFELFNLVAKFRRIISGDSVNIQVAMQSTLEDIYRVAESTTLNFSIVID